MTSMSASAYMWPEISDAARAVTRVAYRQYQQTEYLSRGEIEQGQRQQLSALLTFAAQNVPFYKDSLNAGMAISGDWVKTGFEHLPVLSFADVQRLGTRLQTRYHFSSHGAVQEIALPTSGGKVVRFRGNRLTSFFAYMPYLRAMDWYDWDHAGRLAEIAPGGRDSQVEPKRLPDWGTPFDSGPRLTFCGSARPDRQIAWLTAFEPDYMTVAHDNFEKLVETARNPETHTETHTEIRTEIREILFTGPHPEKLSTTIIRDIFGARLRRGLNLPMLGLVALECPTTDTFHLQSENFIAEILDPAGRPCREGETGTLVLTDLHNFIMPLLRFDTCIRVSNAGTCLCGRGLHTIHLAD